MSSKNDFLARHYYVIKHKNVWSVGTYNNLKIL